MSAESQMTLIEHLRELRSRIIRALVVLLVMTFLCFGLFHEVTKRILWAPLEALDPDTSNVFAEYNPVVARLRPFLAGEGTPRRVDLHALTVTEKFTVKFKLALLSGFILAAPYLLFQMWAFIRSALTQRERKSVTRYFPLSVLLFFAGVAFAYFVALPIAMLFLLSVDPEVKPMLAYTPYFRLLVITIVAAGLAFQLPLVTLALASLGIVPARTLARNRGYAIVLMFVVGAILTPPEPISQCLLALPLICLFELGIVLAKATETRKQKA